MNTQDENNNQATLEYGPFLTAVKEKVAELVENELRGDFEISSNKVLKNNSVELDGLTIRAQESNVSPNIFLNPYYQDHQEGKSVSEIASEILKVYLENRDNISLSGPEDIEFETVKDRICFRLVNKSLNGRLLEDIPHILRGDFALIFSCLVGHKFDGVASIRIDNPLMKQWNTTVDELFRLASRNTPVHFPARVFRLDEKNMIAILENRNPGIFDEDPDTEKDDRLSAVSKFSGGLPMMYVLTNTCGVGGASCMAYEGMLESIYERLGVSFYILPSSVHEVIILPDDGNIDRENLDKMIREINLSTVSDMEILSDHAYLYPGDLAGLDIQN